MILNERISRCKHFLFPAYGQLAQKYTQTIDLKKCLKQNHFEKAIKYNNMY